MYNQAIGAHRFSFVYWRNYFLPAVAMATETTPTLDGVPIEFFLFATTSVGVALFHHYTLQVTLTRLFTVTTYKLIFTGFKAGNDLEG